MDPSPLDDLPPPGSNPLDSLPPPQADRWKTRINPAADGNTLQVYNPFGQNLDTGIALSSGINNFLAGAGKATTDLARGVGQFGAGIADVVSPRQQTLGGLVTGSSPSRVAQMRQDVAESRRLDTPLMTTGSGKAGFMTGMVADSLPAMWIPGANTLAGSAAIGAGLGLLQPSTGTGETFRNVGLGAATGPASILAGRAVGALYQGGKAALEPLFQGGQQRVAARTLSAFAGGPQEAQAAMREIQNAGPVLPGIQSTSAELANNPGISQLERQLRNNPEYLTALTNRNQANRAVMTGALDSIAGTPFDMQVAQRMRSQLSAPLYDSAEAVVVPANAELGSLLARPSMARAWDRAQQLAAERGESLVQPTANDVSGKTLQYLKMSLNDMVDTAEQKGIGAHESNALKSTLAAFNGWTTRNVPQLRAADRAFQDLSRPINQMDVGQALSERLKPALADFGNNTRLSAASYANAVRNGDALVSRTTGLPGSLDSVLNPAQMSTIQQVGEQLARRANADELGRAVGSNTGQNLISQNVLRQMLGPLGLPQSMTERAAQSTLGQSVLRPLQWVAKGGEPRVMDLLAKASLDPIYANRLLAQGISPQTASLIWRNQGLLGISSTSMAEAAQQ
jgi:hypothetical protein